MTVVIVNRDTLDTAEDELRAGTTSDKIMILNMASKYKPGGGVKSGSQAQEEVIGRRSNLMVLLPEPLYESELKNDQVILVRDMTVVKGSDEKFIPEEKMYTVNMLACAAVKIYQNDTQKYITRDQYGHDIYKGSRFRNIMEMKINNIFMTAYFQGYDTLVLGAIGCGAYNNPPKEITAIFLKYLEIYRNCFKKVVFAVLSKNDDNFSWFHDCVQEPYEQNTRKIQDRAAKETASKGKDKGKK